MSLFAELKRRNVFKVGAAYLALAWLVLQLTTIVVPEFGLPAWTMRLVIWFGVIGFPFVLIFSWAYELTPEGLKRESEVDRSQSITHVTGKRLDYIIIVLLVVAIGLFLLQYLRPPAVSSVVEAPATVAEPAASAGSAAKPTTALALVLPVARAPDEKSIAVLPFDNRSKLEDDAFFVDGVHDDILTQLSRIGALKVISRTSVERFRHTELSMKEIAAQLGVSRILEGAVQRAGERVRINVQLIDAASDEHLWAETYDRELNTANLFAIQSEVAQAIAGALSATLSAGEKARAAAVPTQSLEAWEAYQLGKQRMARRTSASLVEAKQYFDKAIALDPGFALAHVGLADVLTLQLIYGSIARTEALVAARAAANRALEIDPELGEAFTTLGGVMIMENQVTDAEAMYLRAIEHSPGYATVHQYYAELLWPQGRVREALAEIERAKALDPLSPIINRNLAAVYAAGGRFDDAERTLRKVIEIDPAFAHGYDVLSALKAYAFRNYSDAVPLQLRAIELDPDSPVHHGGLLQLYAELGDVPAVDHLLDELHSRWPSDEQTQLWAMYAELSRRNVAGAVPWAEKMIAVEPADTFALLVLSLADRAAGHPELALKRYMSADPQLREPLAGRISGTILFSTLEMADLLRKTGQDAGAEEQLKRAEAYTKSVARIGGGFGFADAQILAMRGDKQGALRALREAADVGVRQSWQIVRDYGSGLDSIRGDPEFKSIFADIERDMAAQRLAIADGASKPGF